MQMEMIEYPNIKLFADCASKNDILELCAQYPYIKGFTTNPTLMHKAGVRDYRVFAKEILKSIPDLPISFAVLADEFDKMEDQALDISSWGKNVFVKIPVMNTQQCFSYELLHKLGQAQVKINATALTTLEQVRYASEALAEAPQGYLSILAGRIADSGRDPIPLIAASVDLLRPYKQLELIWASSRELLNIFQAASAGCHVITVTNIILRGLSAIGKPLSEVTLETVRTFYKDVQLAGYTL